VIAGFDGFVNKDFYHVARSESGATTLGTNKFLVGHFLLLMVEQILGNILVLVK
jgi:hypothetical protein